MRYYYQYRADMLDRKGWRHKKSHGTKWCRIPIHGSVRKIEYSYQLEFATFLQGKWCISCGFQQESLYYQPKQLTTKGKPPKKIPLALHCWFRQNGWQESQTPCPTISGWRHWSFLWNFANPPISHHFGFGISFFLPSPNQIPIFPETSKKGYRIHLDDRSSKSQNRSKNSVYHPPSNSHKWRSIGIFYQKKEKWKKGDCYWVLRGSSSQ